MKRKILKLLISILLLICQTHAFAQPGKGAATLSNVKIEGEAVIVTNPQGAVTINFRKGEYRGPTDNDWKKLSKMSGDLLNDVNVALGNHSQILDSRLQGIESEITSLQIAIDEGQQIVIKLLKDLDSQEELFEKEKKELEKMIQSIIAQIHQQQCDKRTAPLSILPGVRQFRLGYKPNAYIYWAGCAASVGSFVVAGKYNSDYKDYKKKITQTNNPDEQDRYFDKMDDAKRKRNDWNTAGYIVGGVVFVGNLIDALFITNRSKHPAGKFIVSTQTDHPYGGISIAYNF